MPKYLVFITTIMVFVSCSQEENEVILFETGFEDTISILDFFIPNDGSFSFTDEEKIIGNGCLITLSSCSSLMAKKIGPLDADYDVSIEAWMKSDYGSKLSLVVSSPDYKILSLETSTDYTVMRKWNHFSTGTLELKEGQTMTIIINPSNSIWGYSWYDDIKVIGIPK